MFLISDLWEELVFILNINLFEGVSIKFILLIFSLFIFSYVVMRIALLNTLSNEKEANLFALALSFLLSFDYAAITLSLANSLIIWLTYLVIWLFVSSLFVLFFEEMYLFNWWVSWGISLLFSLILLYDIGIEYIIPHIFNSTASLISLLFFVILYIFRKEDWAFIGWAYLFGVLLSSNINSVLSTLLFSFIVWLFLALPSIRKIYNARLDKEDRRIKGIKIWYYLLISIFALFFVLGSYIYFISDIYNALLYGSLLSILLLLIALFWELFFVHHAIKGRLQSIDERIKKYREEIEVLEEHMDKMQEEEEKEVYAKMISKVKDRIKLLELEKAELLKRRENVS